MITQRGLATAKNAIITVGGGRGFVVETRNRRVVITGAHCLRPIGYVAILRYAAMRAESVEIGRSVY